MANEERGASVGTILLSFLAGAAIGSGLALLFAPKSGREMRGQIKDLSDDAVDKIKEYVTDAQEKIKSAYEGGKELVKEKQTIISAAIEAGKEAMERGLDAINKGKKFSDKRKFRRLDFHVDASSNYDYWSFSGEIMNISNMGAYLATNGPYAVNDLIELTISFQHGETKLVVRFPCKVARVDGHGVGLISLDLDANNLVKLKSMFEVYKNNPKQLFEEFCKSI